MPTTFRARVALAATALVVTGTPVAAAGAPGAHPAASPRAAYIVVRADDAPVANPRQVTDATRSRRDTALRAIAASVGATPRSTTSTVLSSFTAELTPGQVRALQKNPSVASVTPVRRHRLSAVGTPTTLGLTGTGAGSWAGSFGGRQNAGKGVVIGVVDSGIWPESPAFAGSPLTSATTATVGVGYRPTATTTAMRKADGGLFRGDCSGRAGHYATQWWSPGVCNQTVLSARAFPPASGWFNPGPTNALGREFASPRDGLGHGTHTASTAAGRPVEAAIDGRPLGTSTGVAPGAALAAYKACWSSLENDGVGGKLVENSCWDDSLVAAIDQAVRDGVDVLSLSVSGTTDDPLDPVEVALLGATRAGILVVASAGNDTYAPTDTGTVNHPTPWVMTIGNASWNGMSRLDSASGLGPTTAFGGAVLKPDAVAPGIDVVASVPPAPTAAASSPAFEEMTGTSMATPHAAGLGALLLGRHPSWSPMMVRSALSTTAVPVPGARAFAQGSGRLDARGMVSADLLLDAGPADYLAVARSVGLAGTTPTKSVIDLNQPSVVLPDLAQRSRTVRTFTATKRGAWTITPSLPGHRVTVSPRRGLALRPGQKFTVTVTVQRTTAARGGWSEGSLAVKGATASMRLPLLARTR